MASRKIGIVYGGTSIGLMGAIADAVLEAGGEAVGVLPTVLERREIAHPKLTELFIVGSMHERKARMAELADAFIAMPGGFGTLDELFEILTWAQIGLHDKPIGLYDVEGYYGPLRTVLDRCVAEGFSKPAYLDPLVQSADPNALLDALEAKRSKANDHAGA
jgi:hypothetical protein